MFIKIKFVTKILELVVLKYVWVKGNTKYKNFIQGV